MIIFFFTTLAIGAVRILRKHFYRLTQSRIENILCCTSIYKNGYVICEQPLIFRQTHVAADGVADGHVAVALLDHGDPGEAVGHAAPIRGEHVVT